MFFHPFARHGFPGTFEQSYHVYPVSFIDKPHLENGDKVILPSSALDRLAQLQIDYPMLFEVTNPSVGRTSHCGVLEFIAEEGMVYMPYWMMQNLLLQEGDIVTLKNATLQKGTYVKLQPHTKDFLDISNPKAVLETTLRNFSCLTKGDNIMVAYNNKKYYIDIVEAKPAEAISIIETDCEVDFAPPLDYKEPEAMRPSSAPSSEGAPSSRPAEAVEAAAGHQVEEPKFIAFRGLGKRLDGRPSKLTAEETAPSASSGAAVGRAGGAPPAAQATQAAAAIGVRGAAASETAKGGKLVFGASRAVVAGPKAGSKAKNAPVKPETLKEEKTESSFQAFSGKGYSLK